jgi:hypothetical protein
LLAFADNRENLGPFWGPFEIGRSLWRGKANFMALTDTAIRLARAEATDRKLADSKGLYLLVTAAGSKLWRLKYRIDGKEKKLALGGYPEVSLKVARARRDAARHSAQAGSDPSIAKREARIAKRIAAANTFAGIAEEYIAKLEAEGKAAVTIAKTRWLLTKLSPALGTRPIAEVSPHELLAVLKKVERAGQRETARRLRSFSSRVFRYEVASARASVDPAQPLQGALISPVAKHHAAITDPIALGKLLRSIEAYSGQPVTKLALRFTPHVYQRPGEVRKAEWSEIDFDKALWTIPAERMKQRQPHPCPTVATGVGDPPRSGGIEWRRALHFPETGIAAEADVRKRSQWGVAPDGLWFGRHDCARLPLDRVIAVERKRQMEFGRDRARPFARRSQSGPRCLSSWCALAGASRDDAMVERSS